MTNPLERKRLFYPDNAGSPPWEGLGEAFGGDREGTSIVYLVIHCTATPEGREVTGNDIRRWHTSPVSRGGRGWKQVGYTDLIRLDGTVERLVANNEDEWVDNWEITNGVKGINGISRHIVYAGGLDRNGRPKDTRTEAQREAMKRYVSDFIQRFPHVQVKGHNDFANKDCPCFDVAEWVRTENSKQLSSDELKVENERQ